VCDDKFISKNIPNWLNRENRIILVTGAHPQKNLPFFLDCFIELSDDIKLDVKVDIVGVNNEELDKKYNLINSIKFHGKVSQSELLSLYDNSKILVMPSLFESYSIPLLEAKYRGLHILSSDGGATIEVASSYAHFFKSNNAVDLKKKLLEIISIIDKPPKYDNSNQVDVNYLYWKGVT
jgi:glycosyltransferase involved in cell wall biosynthesis